MSGYLLSSANQTFAALEQEYGQAALLSSAQQIVASGLAVHQATAPSPRRDKTGSRTRLQQEGGRRDTGFEVRSFMTSQNVNGLPFCDPLFTAALGGTASLVAAMTIAKASGQTLTTEAPHGLTAGSAVASGGEIRFVTALSSAMTFNINAPFSRDLTPGSNVSAAATYRLSTSLPSLTLFDYWGMQGTFSRVVTGAVIEEFELDITGDRHGLRFTGRAADLIDSAAFVPGTAGLQVFPQLPTQSPIDYAIVPGHLGQVWFGNPTAMAYTLTQATIRLRNNVVLRDRELGSGLASSGVPGRRIVEADISLLAQDDNMTAALYQVARDYGSMSLLLQLGTQSGQMMAVYLPSMVPEVPRYDDSGEWVKWQVTNSQAMGEADDELYLAFA